MEASVRMALKLSVLDQSLARAPDQAATALQETLQMAKWCEELDYTRFWVSEHHAFPSVAGSAPEVLLAAVGAATRSIRIGSGGIMLPHYSAYKVAEVFSVLANLYPGRVDLGIGRAPGADMATAVALATDGHPKFDAFPRLTENLSEYLWSDTASPIVSPRPPEDIPLWMLGSSSDSAILAAQRGLPYNLALFINPQADSRLIGLYKAHFQPSKQLAHPYAILTLSVFCADTEEQARAHEKAFIASRQNSRASGTQRQVKKKIEQIAALHNADEIMAVTNIYYLKDRKRSFQLLREAFE